METLRERHQKIAAINREEPSQVAERVHGQQYERLQALVQQLAEGVFQFIAELRNACTTSTNPGACTSFCETFEQVAQILSSDGVLELDLAQDCVALALRKLEEVVNSLSEEPPVTST